MVVDIQPLAVSAVPDTGLFRLRGAGTALAVDVLCQADVCDAGSIFTNDMDVGVQDGGVYWLAVLRQYCQTYKTISFILLLRKNRPPYPPASFAFYSPSTGFWDTIKIAPAIFQAKSK